MKNILVILSVLVVCGLVIGGSEYLRRANTYAENKEKIEEANQRAGEKERKEKLDREERKEKLAFEREEAITKIRINLSNPLRLAIAVNRQFVARKGEGLTVEKVNSLSEETVQELISFLIVNKGRFGHDLIVGRIGCMKDEKDCCYSTNQIIWHADKPYIFKRLERYEDGARKFQVISPSSSFYFEDIVLVIWNRSSQLVEFGKLEKQFPGIDPVNLWENWRCGTDEKIEEF